MVYLLVVFSSLFAQLGPQILWSQEFGGFGFYDIVKTSNGTFTAVGDMDMPVSGSNLWLMNFNDTGKILWNKSYGDNGYIISEKIQLLPDKGYIAGTTRWSANNSSFDRIWIFRLKENGDTLWTFLGRDSCSESANMVVPTKDNGFLMVGASNYYNTNKTNAFFLKLDTHGDTLWSRFYGSPYWDRAYRAIELSDSGFMVLGYTQINNSAQKADIWLLRLNARGDTLYTRKMGRHDYSVYPNDIKKTPDNGFVAVGAISNIDSSQRASSGGYLEEDTMFVLKLNAMGEKEWLKKYGNAIWSRGQSIEITPDGGFIVCGTIDLGTKDTPKCALWLVRLNPQGDVVWSQNYRDTLRSSTFGDAIIYAGGNRYIVSGEKNDTGNVTWLFEFEEVNNAPIVLKNDTYINDLSLFQNTGIQYVNVLGRSLKSINRSSSRTSIGTSIIITRNKLLGNKKILLMK